MNDNRESKVEQIEGYRPISCVHLRTLWIEWGCLGNNLRIIINM